MCLYVCGGVEWCSGIWAGTVSMRECGGFMATRSMIDDLWLDAWMHRSTTILTPWSPLSPPLPLPLSLPLSSLSLCLSPGYLIIFNAHERRGGGERGDEASPSEYTGLMASRGSNIVCDLKTDGTVHTHPHTPTFRSRNSYIHVRTDT